MKQTFLFAGVLALILSGCVAAGPDDSQPPIGDGPPIADAACRSSRAYVQDLATAADSIAERIDRGEVTNNATAFEAFRTSSQSARERFNHTLGQTLDQQSPPSSPPQAAMWRSLATGFRRAGPP